jgi:hypothetical protein
MNYLNQEEDENDKYIEQLVNTMYPAFEEEIIIPENESEEEYLTSEEHEQLDNFEIERRISEMDYPIGNKLS